MSLTEENLKQMAESAGESVAAAAVDWETASSTAYEALDYLNKTDMAEMKAYKAPPAKVKLVMEAAFICLKEPFGKDGSSDDVWAKSKKLLDPKSLITKFRAFDPKSIDSKMLAKLKPYMEQSEIDPERVGAVSKAAKSIAMWVQAVWEYGNTK